MKILREARLPALFLFWLSFLIYLVTFGGWL